MSVKLGKSRPWALLGKYGWESYGSAAGKNKINIRTAINKCES